MHVCAGSALINYIVVLTKNCIKARTSNKYLSCSSHNMTLWEYLTYKCMLFAYRFGKILDSLVSVSEPGGLTGVLINSFS